jgi:hypothetical protein
LESSKISQVIDRIVSSNFGSWRDALRPSLIVLYFTVFKTAEAGIERLCDPAFEVLHIT